MAAFQFYFQSRKQRKIGCIGNESHVVFGQKIYGAKGNVKGVVVMKQRPDLSLSKLGAKFSHIFKKSPQNVTVVCGIGCLGLQDEFFVNNPLDVKENDEHALNFAFHLSRLFRSQ
jgi:hypothetical protein